VRWHKPPTILIINITMFVMHVDITYDKVRWHKSAIILIINRIFGVLTPLSAIFQLFHGDQFFSDGRSRSTMGKHW
jgi:hypothetical protein